MTLPGETEAGSAGRQPCRGITWRDHRADASQRGSLRSRACTAPEKSHRMIDPHALKIPAPEGRNLH